MNLPKVTQLICDKGRIPNQLTNPPTIHSSFHPLNSRNKHLRTDILLLACSSSNIPHCDLIYWLSGCEWKRKWPSANEMGAYREDHLWANFSLCFYSHIYFILWQPASLSVQECFLEEQLLLCPHSSALILASVFGVLGPNQRWVLSQSISQHFRWVSLSFQLLRSLMFLGFR